MTFTTDSLSVPAQHNPAQAHPRASGARARLLIVEDETVVLRDMRQMLTAAGYSVAAASTERDAADWLARYTPDLALIDISLPEGPTAGLQLAESLGSGRVPVLFVTAHSDGQIISRAKAVGPAGYLLKPFTGEQLVTAVSFALDRAPATRRAGVAAAIASIDDRLDRLTALLTDQPASVDLAARVDALPGLSARERDVLRLLVANRRVPQIAEKLFVSQHTVRSHLKAMFRKLHVRNQAELISLVIDDPDAR